MSHFVVHSVLFLYFADTIAKQDCTDPSDNLLLVGFSFLTAMITHYY